MLTAGPAELVQDSPNLTLERHLTLASVLNLEPTLMIMIICYN
jgi:hypothetical protein